jgi:hypothetical protein
MPNDAKQEVTQKAWAGCSRYVKSRDNGIGKGMKMLQMLWAK